MHALVGLLTCHDAKLQLEALGCLINLLTADHSIVKSVVREASPYLITYLHSGGTLLQELSAWALGNIAADCSDCCSVLKSQNFLQALIGLLKVKRLVVNTRTDTNVKCSYILADQYRRCTPFHHFRSQVLHAAGAGRLEVSTSRRGPWL